MTAPLTPADCDLRDYPWMPLDCTRLLTSETWMLGTNDERVAALTLWIKSWHQMPAGSLPNNERMLAVLSEAGSKWPKVREHAMRGWVLCDDGRLYHPVVAEKANHSWGLKLAQRARTEAARAALEAKRRAARGESVAETVAVSVTESVTDTATGSIRTEQIRTEKNVSKGGDAPRSASPPPAGQGARLSADWMPDEPGYEGATDQTLARFRDYWTAQPGAKGRKTDWQATWRNWCRRDAEDRRKAPPGKTSALTTYDQNEALLRLCREPMTEVRMVR